MQLLIATTNLGKIKEIKSILSNIPAHLVTPAEIGLNLDVDETGSSYRENAEIKALAFSRASQLPVLSDDTGLEVAALSGLPGIHSARFVNSPHASDGDRRKLLLEKLSAYPRPWKARFICVATLVIPGGSPISMEGECVGEIIPEERGEYGFGYDPLFLVQGTRKTMAELTLPEKNSISHRAKAVQALIPFLQE
ncbi:MAG TPA: RdgB/HAM1 family non-canonical purine NTP pyrophosphatase [Anaerolineaceae bacterium]|nr:RdgB/HAM1 family non-canonical purine NTP pyrophosphatase [Anaerolineaceae bacterium]